ncbi:hypothetical protein, partial [uncultured Paraglaciecola sp.]|uniref:hypothetical protein n=1 Tax=uncultured Paraglaciecola sp. TaxID=1765024 RepID=UPI0025CDF922
YHQSKQEKNDDGVTSLRKVEYKYIYNIPFPPSFDDIIKSEADKQVCIDIYQINKDNNEINPKDKAMINTLKGIYDFTFN